MNQSTTNKMIRKLLNGGVLPQVINLKECINTSLESIIRDRQNDYSVRGTKLKIIYLLDGLDEISQERADSVISQINELSRSGSTDKIVITCRTGNFNQLILKNYYDKISEVKVGQLGIADVDGYFEAKGNARKSQAYKVLKKINNDLISAINDVLGMILLWESVELLGAESTILDVYELKVKHILKHPQHYKELHHLNILNPKSEAIVNLNEKISYRFQEKFQYLFPQIELQQLIAEELPRTDYAAINDILNYLGSLFFDSTLPSPNSSEPHYVYRHRRYQEYFYVKKLQKDYEQNPEVLRGLSILSNSELFETFFIRGLRKKYLEENNIIGSLDVSLLDVYLGNHKGWGVDSPYYLESDDFTRTLINQNDYVFNLLFEDENLNLKSKIFINIKNLTQNFEDWDVDKDDYYKERYLIEAWESGFARLIRLLTEFDKAGRANIANDILNNIIEVQNLYKKFDFLNKLPDQKRMYLQNPIGNNLYSFIYYQIKFKKIEPNKILADRVLSSRKRNKSKVKHFNENTFRHLLDVVLDIAPDKLEGLLPKFTNEMMVILLNKIANLEYISVFISHTELHTKIKSFLETFDTELSENNFKVVFFKKYFGLLISEPESTFLSAYKDKLVHERDIDWHMSKYSLDFAIINYANGEDDFDAELNSHEEDDFFNYYSERIVSSLLFIEYIKLLDGKTSFESLYRKYAKYCELNYDVRYKSHVLEYFISEIWALIYINSSAEINTKKELMSRLVEELHIPKYSFYLDLMRNSGEIFDKLISESEIKTFEDELDDWGEDFQSKVDRQLQLSLMYRNIDSTKATNLFIQAIIDGTLRHGWRKDPLVHYYLVKSLSILLEKNYLTGQDVLKRIEEVYQLVLRAYQISDGSGTARGPYNLIETLAVYNRELSDIYKEKYIEHEGKYNVANKIHVPAILSKVRSGLPVDVIEEDFKQFRLEYDYERVPLEDFYEEKIIVYLAIAKSELYSDDERRKALQSIGLQISEAKKLKVKYLLNDSNYREVVKNYIDLCKQFDIKPLLKLEKRRDNTYSRPYSAQNELNFQNELMNATTSRQCDGLFKRLNNYKNNIVLKDRESWTLLLDMNFRIKGNISLVILYLERINYPHTDFYSANSHYAHLVVASAFDNPDYKLPMLNHICRKGGHQGFYNLIQVYAELGDRTMSLALFERYLAMCKLLTN